jgi:hypothetical protein
VSRPFLIGTMTGPLLIVAINSTGRLPWAYFSTQFARTLIKRFRRTDAEMGTATMTLGSLRYPLCVPKLAKKLRFEMSCTGRCHLDSH